MSPLRPRPRAAHFCPLALALALALPACSGGPEPGDMSQGTGTTAIAATTDDEPSTGAAPTTGAGPATTEADPGATESAGASTGDPAEPTTGGPGETTDDTGAPVEGERRVVGYFTAWSVYERDFHVHEIDAARLTHLNYGFANLTPEGICALGDKYADTEKAYPGDEDSQPLKGSFHQLQLLKQAHPHLRALLSVGGWTWSGNFSPAAASAAGRQELAASCVTLMRDYGFDGLDIDWEFPVGGGLEGNQVSPDDKHNYTLLLAELRAQLEVAGAEDGRHYLLTIAAPAGPEILKNLELAELPAYLDWINLMAYDFFGAWAPATGFNAPLHAPQDDPDPTHAAMSVDAAVSAYLAAGVPADQLVLGVPFYGRSFQAAGGLFAPHGGAGPGTWEPGVLDYHDLAANYVPTYTRQWHEDAAAPWLYDAASQTMISYDDPESIARKAAYIVDRGLGGAMVWELSGDTPEGALLGTLAGALLP